ncbi:MAG: hypothetical protein GF355_05735 [Candidatus Eisenbacteria bacterium]|nr:hypothetical protein [Candidatus Eisenbacteria bacterium]
MESATLHFLSRPGLWWWAALAVALAVGAWTYFRLRAPLGPGWVWGLRILRIAAFLLVLLPLLEPVLSRVTSRSGPAPLLVLLDSSQSMSLPHGAAPASEAETARGASEDEPPASRLQASRETVRAIAERWSGEFQLSFARFDRTLRLVAGVDSLPVRAAGPTALGEALEGALTSPALGSLSGIVLLSDGVHTSGRDPLTVARNSPLPIYPIAFGDTLPADDLLIRQVETNEEAVLGEPLPMRLTLEAWGHAGEPVRIEVRENGELVAETETVLQGGAGEAQDVQLDVRPRRPGLVLYSIQAELPAGEDRLPINNERLAAVEVREAARRVLVIEPHPAWDFTFVRRTLAADSALVLTNLVQDLPDRWRVLGDPVVDGWPQGPSQWRHFSAVILMGGDPPPPRAAELARFVDEGGGLFFIPGSEGWQGLAGGALAELLPVTVGGPRGAVQNPAAVVLTEAGQVDPLTLVLDNPHRNSSAWAALPPIWPTPRRVQAKPGARTLLSWRNRPAEPAFAVAGYGQGRVAALCGYGLWRWVFLPRAVRNDPLVAEDFLRQTVRWLMEPSTQDRFRVVPVRRVFQSGDVVEFAAQLRTPGYEPLEGARIDLAVRDAETGETIRRARLAPSGRAGGYQARLAPLPRGAYDFEARIRTPTGDQEQRDGRFWVEGMGVETYRSWADHRTLRLIAEASDGVAARPGELAELRGRVVKTHRRSESVNQADLWNHWAVFAAFVLLMGMEWFLRRRRGLA